MGKEHRNTAIFTAFDDLEQPELATPEKNLLRAVLINAIADMARPGEFSRRARDYFTSSEDDYVFAFRSVCQYLNVNPHHILILVGLEENPRKKPEVPQQGQGGQAIADQERNIADDYESRLR